MKKSELLKALAQQAACVLDVKCKMPVGSVKVPSITKEMLGNKAIFKGQMVDYCDQQLIPLRTTISRFRREVAALCPDGVKLLPASRLEKVKQLQAQYEAEAKSTLAKIKPCYTILVETCISDVSKALSEAGLNAGQVFEILKELNDNIPTWEDFEKKLEISINCIPLPTSVGTGMSEAHHAMLEEGIAENAKAFYQDILSHNVRLGIKIVESAISQLSSGKNLVAKTRDALKTVANTIEENNFLNHEELSIMAECLEIAYQAAVSDNKGDLICALHEFNGSAVPFAKALGIDYSLDSSWQTQAQMAS